MAHPALTDFVERMGLLLESEGLPRIGGRLMGFLIVHPEAFSLDELAERLQVSKASISTNARVLEEKHILERTTSPGDRRDYYRLAPGGWEAMLRAAQLKWHGMRELLTATAACVPEECEVARCRLIEAEQFHLLMIDGVDQLIERWTRRASATPVEESEDTSNDASPAGASEER